MLLQRLLVASRMGVSGVRMEPNLQSGRPQVSFRGATGLIVAVAVVAILLIAFPVYRWFFVISLGIGLVVAAILFCGTGLDPSRRRTSRIGIRSAWDSFLVRLPESICVDAS